MSNESPQEGPNLESFAAEFIDAMLEEREEYGILGDFVFVGEIIDPEGMAHLMVVTSDRLVEWKARGMMMAADDYISGGMIE